MNNRSKLNRGRYKLAIYFKNHRDANGRPKYYHSTKQQDQRGKSIPRFTKKLVLDRRNQIAWAGLYEDKRQIMEFREANNEWKPVG